MANYSTTATVNLSVNGKQAAMVMDQMTKKAEALRKQIEKEKLSPNPDTAKLRKLQAELNNVNKVLAQCKPTALQVEEVIKNLDKASPRELQKTLSKLQSELGNLKRGSKEWDRQVEKIKKVKAEIQKVNSELRENATATQKFKNFFNDWSGAIMGVVGAITGLIAAGRGAVKAFADMDQEMANVRKYTSMSVEQVENLNDAFKKIDTRTGREQLNKYAEDAGRLGKKSMEDVLGYSKAANKVNIALWDLGDDATIKISKLAGIFGEEARLGTERALLSVGSAVNELSMSCSASAPYIVEFTNRLGGVGHMAGLTIPQITAIGAVLDANGQKVESSATAVSQVMVRLFRDPAKYAKVAGMDVKYFTNLVRNDMNKAFLTFLDTLAKAGGMDVLSPMFKDMGENGARAIAALSTLAGNIDMVREKQDLATSEYRKAISVDREYNIQNNTVQASLEKAKARFHEMAISLGQDLQPVMKHTMTTTSALLRVLQIMVNFLKATFPLWSTLTATILTYTVVTKIANLCTKESVIVQTLAAAKAKLHALAVGLQTVAYELLTFNLNGARVALAALNHTMKMNPAGLMLSAIAALTVTIVHFFQSANKEMKEYRTKVNEALESVEEFTEKSQKETDELDKLFAVLRVGDKDSKRYKDTKQQIISQYGKYLQGLIDENGEITNLTYAYNRLTLAIRRTARERGLANAEQEIQDNYYKSTASILSDLEKSLRQYGAPEESIIKITDAVAKHFATGQPIDKFAKDAIEMYSKAEPVLDNDMQPMGGAERAFRRMFWMAPQKPNAVLNNTSGLITERQRGENSIEAQRKANEPFRDVPTETLKEIVEELKKVKESNKPISTYLPSGLSEYVSPEEGARRQGAPLNVGIDMKATVVPAQVDSAVEAIMSELAIRGVSISNNISGEEKNYYSSKSDQKATGSGKDAVMEKIKKELKEIKGVYEKTQADIITLRNKGKISFDNMIKRMRKAEVKYYYDSLDVFKKYRRTSSEEYKKFLLQKAEADAKFKREETERRKKSLDKDQKDLEEKITNNLQAAKKKDNYRVQIFLELALHEARVNYFKELMKLYDKSSKEWMELEEKRDEELKNHKLKKDEIYLNAKKRIFDKYQKKETQTDLAIYEIHLVEYLKGVGELSTTDADEAIKKIKDKYIKHILPESDFEKKKKELEDKLGEINKAFANGLIDEVQMKKATGKVNSELRKLFGDELNNSGEWTKISKDFVLSWIDMIEAIKNKADDIPTKIAEVIASTSAIISTGMQVSTQFVEAEMQIQESKIRKRYDKEIEFAEGNSYLIRKLEKQREKEIADLKNEGAKKQFAMQVIQTVAQTAQNAVSAYGAALQLGPIGLTLAPIAAAIAAAQGAVQIALLKKQQQAAESAGYSEGGFTADGPKNKPAGIVHAGEWVASQKLTKDRRTRPVIEALEFMQRTNSIGRLDSEAVSRSLSPVTPQVIVVRPENGGNSIESGQLAVVIDRLTKRLEEPFVTVNTVTGDSGINKALADYNRLIKNASRR